MAFPDIFTSAVTEQLIGRIEQLSPETPAQWGKMTVAQMLAHCCITYEIYLDGSHPKPNFFMAFLLRTFVKNGVVNEVPYPQNTRTAPVFMVNDEKNFAVEQARLIAYIRKSQALGVAYFEQQTAGSFGKMTAPEWNNLFYKHLDHHLSQFGV